MGGQASAAQGTPTGYTPEKYAAVKDEVALDNGIVAADQFHWTTLLSRFEQLLPDDVSIRNIQPNFNEHSVQLACIAHDVSAITRFVDNLWTSTDLSHAYLQRHGAYELEVAGRKQVQVGCSLVIRAAF